MNLVCCAGAPLSGAEPDRHMSGPITYGVETDAAMAGTRLNPDGADQRLAGAPLGQPMATGDVYPYHNVVGPVTRSIRRPSAPTTTIHLSPYPADGGQSTSGAHGEMTHMFELADGEQTPFPVAQAKSFRAPAAPYDQAVYYGWVPSNGEGDR